MAPWAPRLVLMRDPGSGAAGASGLSERCYRATVNRQGWPFLHSRQTLMATEPRCGGAFSCEALARCSTIDVQKESDSKWPACVDGWECSRGLWKSISPLREYRSKALLVLYLK